MLKGKTILITGASSGIGKAASIALARKGAEIILLASNEKALEECHDEIAALGQEKPLICTFDLINATIKEYQALEAVLDDKIEQLDGLIHAAGQLQSLTPLAYTSMLQWHQVIQLNLNARFALTKVCLPYLQKSDRGRLLFLLSEMAKKKGQAHWGAYQVSEQATRSLFEIFSDELDKSSICVNALEIPPCDTRLRRKAYPFEDREHLIQPDDLADAFYQCFNDELKHGDKFNAKDTIQCATSID